MPQPRKGHVQFYRGAPPQDYQPRKVTPSRGGQVSLAKAAYRQHLATAAWAMLRPNEHAKARYRTYSTTTHRTAAKATAVAWGDVVEAGLRLFIDEPEWPIAKACIKWMQENPAAAQRALQEFWLGRPPGNLRNFDNALPRERFPHPITRRALSTMLRIIQTDRLVDQMRAGLANAAYRTAVKVPAESGVGRGRSPDVEPDSDGKAAVDAQPSATPQRAQGRGAAAFLAGSVEEQAPITNHPEPSVGAAAFSVVDLAGVARIVALESHATPTFQVISEADQLDAERCEAALVQRYAGWLARQNVHVVRYEIVLPGHAHPLYTDLYDPSRAEIVEAKASAERHDVRMALGQLLDYMRYVDHKSLAILTPSRLSDDLLDLLSRHTVMSIYETPTGNFDRPIIASTHAY